jgi:hypothetical protein
MFTPQLSFSRNKNISLSLGAYAMLAFVAAIMALIIPIQTSTAISLSKLLLLIFLILNVLGIIFGFKSIKSKEPLWVGCILVVIGLLILLLLFIPGILSATVWNE